LEHLHPEVQGTKLCGEGELKRQLIDREEEEARIKTAYNTKLGSPSADLVNMEQRRAFNH
jgi:hypothetical protein